MQMHMSDLVKQLAQETGLSKNLASQYADTMFDIISRRLRDGDEIRISGFGSFKSQQRAARAGRNLRTGAAIEIAAKRVAKFKPAKALEEALNQVAEPMAARRRA